ncbi:hypothetical protein E4U58_003162 [Claviceps cyperi]|nr:hypothetical protein E4U58_003162 [Claviceps cyperi]
MAVATLVKRKTGANKAQNKDTQKLSDALDNAFWQNLELLLERVYSHPFTCKERRPFVSWKT